MIHFATSTSSASSALTASSSDLDLIVTFTMSVFGASCSSSDKEDLALGELAARIRSRPDRDCLAWMVAEGRSTPPERVLLLEEGADLAGRVLPKFECGPLSSTRRPTDPSSGRQLQGVQVRRQAVGKLLSGLLFTENKKVEVYAWRGGARGFEMTHSGSPAEHSGLGELVEKSGEDGASGGFLGDGDDCVVDDYSRPLVALTVEESGGVPSVALFLVDRGARMARLCCFADNAECDLLESVLEGVDPLECRVAKNWNAQSKAGKILSDKGFAVVLSDARPKRDFDDALKCLEKFVDFSKHDLSVLEKDSSQAVRAGTLLLPLLSASQAEEGPQKKSVLLSLELLRTDAFMRVSASTLEGLHIFEGAKSVFSILNHTRTAGGERMLRSWLRQPLRQPQAIRNRLNVVEALREEAGLKKNLHERSLRRVPDLQKIYKRLQTKRLTLADLYKAYCAVKAAAAILSELQRHFEDERSAVATEVASPLAECLPKLKKFEKLCEKTLDDEALAEGEYRVRPSFDETLTELKGKIDAVKKSINQSARKEAQRLNLELDKVLKLESSTQHGYYLRVTLKDERLLRQKKGVQVFDSTKAGVKFRTPPLETLNSEFEELTKSYEMHQQYIVEEILQIAEGYGAHLVNLYSLVSRLDCLVSFAVAADSASLPYVKPEILDDDEDQVLQLEQARHPILEQMGVNFIPNDVLLDRKKNFKIITGPNLGGKSTYMRTAGVCVYMAQVGSLVPCSSARLSACDAVLVRMGAGDSQRRGVSTFMAEMLDAARILRDASHRSLVLIDELGRGTSTYDGFGLAWAISSRIATSTREGSGPGAMAFFATHFHEMTQLAEEAPGVANLFCDALVKDGEFTLLYRVQPGVCHKSFGIEVAKIAGFPDRVVKAAQEYLTESELELKGAFVYKKDIKRLLDEYEAAGNDENRKRKITEEARELAKKMREEVMTPATGT